MSVYITLYKDRSMCFWSTMPEMKNHQIGARLFEVCEMLEVVELTEWAGRGFVKDEVFREIGCVNYEENP